MRLLPGVVLCLFSVAPLRAQTITGTILGEVKDSAGAFVANAAVTVENSATELAKQPPGYV